jgi:hypothetical protein
MDAHARYAALALGVATTSAAAAVTPFRAALKRVWRLGVDNRLKEPLWRLAVDAVPGGRIHPWHCPGCPADPAPAGGRYHAFWACPVAVAVRAELARALAAAAPPPAPAAAPAPPPAVTAAHVWLLLPPVPAVDARVWELVATVAVAAMEHGRQLVWVRGGPLAGGLASVSRLAAARFWQLLGDCVTDLNVRRPRWRLQPGVAHPFVAVGADGTFVLRMPAADAAGPDGAVAEGVARAAA